MTLSDCFIIDENGLAKFKDSNVQIREMFIQLHVYSLDEFLAKHPTVKKEYAYITMALTADFMQAAIRLIIAK